jgi:hypothetical protein
MVPQEVADVIVKRSFFGYQPPDDDRGQLADVS